VKKWVYFLVVITVIAGTLLLACSSQTTPTTSAPPASTTSITATTSTTAPVQKTTVTAPSTTTVIATTAVTVPSVTTTAAASTGSQQRGGILRWIETAGPGTPIGAEWLGYNYNAGEWAMDVLIKSLPDGTMTVNDSLCTSFSINATGTPPSMTFNLRKGVKFIDGTDVNAQAVKWNMQMITKGGLYKSTTDYWASFDVIDDYTLRCNFPMWRNTMLRAWENYYVVSPTAFEKNGEDYMKYHIIGSGPFRQTDFQQDVKTTYTRNDNFRLPGQPYLDGVQMLYVADTLTQEALIRSGGAEALTASPKAAARFANDPTFNIVKKDQGPYTLVPDSLNADSPYSNLKVRQALQYAVDMV
jgi:ABC-type transport system substrate-binding protein